MGEKEKSSHSSHHLSRRDILLQLGGMGLLKVFGGHGITLLTGGAQGRTAPLLSSAPGVLSPEDDQLLDELEKRSFQFFWEQASPQTGLIKDRCNVLKNDTTVVASIAATGFGLTALCIGEQRGFISSSAARDRVLLTLRFLWKKMPTHRGFFYHFADLNNGERIWDSEVSSVDTSILLCGILTCRRHFEQHSEISLLAYEILNRVDWSWLIPRYCRMAGPRNSAFFPIAGTITAK